MRTRKKSSLFLLFCLIYLCCLVQQCHLIMFATLANSMGNAVGQAVTMTGAMGLNILQSIGQGMVSAVVHGFGTLHTMTIALISGFMMGNLALAAFILFLLAVVPAEEGRSLSGNTVFTPLIPYHNLTDHRGVPLLLSNSSFHSRNKRSTLVNNATLNATLNTTTFTVDDKYPLPASLLAALNSTDRIPRFLTRVIQNDPFNCLPLLLCGLSASRKPSERTETLNDYAYLLKEFLRVGDDSPEDQDDLSDEDAGTKKKGNTRLRSSMQILNQLVQGGFEGKKKDEVDKLIEDMRREEEEKLEEEVLNEMAQDPSDLTFALQDMKIRGVKKTLSKMPKDSKKKYITKLVGGEDSLEENDDMDDLIDDDGDPDIPKALMGRFEKPDVYRDDESGSLEGAPYRKPYRQFYNTRDLVRGAFPPPPPSPPVPDYGGASDEELYKRNVALLEKNLERDAPPWGFGFLKRSGPPMNMGRPPPQHPHRPSMFRPPPPMNSGRRRSKDVKHVKHTASNRAFLQKKRGELAEADNVYDKSRVAAEVGAVTRNNRQCRALFNECPISTVARPVAAASQDAVSNTPFLSRAVNNIRRVILGSPNGETSKAKRVSEIKEVVQQLNPQGSSQGGSEVKVVLNIGPTPPPNQMMMPGHPDLRAGGIPPGMGPQPGMAGHPPMMQNGMPPQMMFPNMGMMNPPHMGMMPSMHSSMSPPSPSPTGFSTQLKYVVPKRPLMTTRRPSTTSRPIPGTTKKTMVYRNPSSPPSMKPLPTMSTYPPVDFDDLEQLLKTTMPPSESGEMTTQYPDNMEETTVVVNTLTDVVSMEQDDRSAEDDLVLPTKYPMSKEKYAQSLRETLQIFDKFKAAHKTPVTVTITRSTDKPSTTVATITRKQANKIKKKDKDESNKTSTPATKQNDKGEQADLDYDNEQNQEGDDIEHLIKIFNAFRGKEKPKRSKKGKKSKKKKRKRKRKKGKGKKKGQKSSEEDSEEDHDPPPPHKHPALVAVPPPHIRQKIHWRSGTTLVKDGVYHFLFGKKVTKPLPPYIAPVHADSDEHEHSIEHHDKPIRHDTHYFDLPNHDLPQKDISVQPEKEDAPEKDDGGENDDASEKDDDLESDDTPDTLDKDDTRENYGADKDDTRENDDIPGNGNPQVYHRLRTSESVEDDIPPPPPIQYDEESDKEPERNSGSSSVYEYSSLSGGKTATRRPAKLKEPRPIPRPDPEPSSYEDDDEDDGDDISQRSSQFPIRRIPHYDSRSVETSYEEESNNGATSVESKESPAPFLSTPFSLVRNGNKLKLKSKGTATPENIIRPTIAAKRSKKKKPKNKSESQVNGNSRSRIGDIGKNISVVRKTSSVRKSASKSNVMAKAKAHTTTTVKPRRKILKYKNG